RWHPARGRHRMDTRLARCGRRTGFDRDRHQAPVVEENIGAGCLTMPVKTFSAALEPRTRNNMNWAIIWLPFDVQKVWGSRGHLRVKGEINGFPFRTALLPTGDGRHFMIVNKQMQKGAKVRPGMDARFRME